MAPWEKEAPSGAGKLDRLQGVKTVQNCSTQEAALPGTIH
jgi:hypothetical protein